jgi:hypothetical protein
LPDAAATRRVEDIGIALDIFEEKTQVFTIRIWFERREIPGAPPVWRGLIRNERTDEQQFFQEVEDMVEFIEHALRETGGVHAVRRPARSFWRCMQDWIRQISTGNSLVL